MNTAKAMMMQEMTMPNCEVCGEPMPTGEEMFKYHGYSGPCPKPPKPVDKQFEKTDGLYPCPFCGGRAEMDTRRSFRALSGGNLETATAVYCLQCSADMTICHSDVPHATPSDLAEQLTEQWNKRAPLRS